MESLSSELQLNMLQYIARPPTLRSPCLTSGRLWELVLPALYDVVELDLKRCTISNRRGFFTSANRGHALVRSLVFLDPDVLHGRDFARRVISCDRCDSKGLVSCAPVSRSVVARRYVTETIADYQMASFKATTCGA